MLRRSLPPSRKKALKRVLMKRRLRATGPDRDVVDAVYERAGYACEICTEAVGDHRGTDHHVHHRRPRALGGTKREDTNSPANLLLLCPQCHREVESHRAVAQSMGWLLTQTDDPERVAVLVQRDRWVYLGADARYAADPPGGTDA
jgi:5-methylcytosine-specific restriction protein A